MVDWKMRSSRIWGTGREVIVLAIVRIWMISLFRGMGAIRGVLGTLGRISPGLVDLGRVG